MYAKGHYTFISTAVCIILCLFAVAGCRPVDDNVALPTLAQLPTTAPTSTVPPVISPTPTITHTATLTETPVPTFTAAPSAAPNPLVVTVPPTPLLAPFTPSTPLEIDFDRVFSLQLEFRQPIRDLLAANRQYLPPTDALTVSAYRDVDDWAKITLVPSRFVDNGWTQVESIAPHVVEILAQRMTPTDWNVYLVGSPGLDAVRALVPPGFVDLESPMPPLAGAYLFPWTPGQSWWAIQGWHDGNALDFQPGIGARYAVLASEAGVLKELCSDGYQSLLQIQHADGRATYYLHVTLALSVRRHLLDQPVQRGQYLGELIDRETFLTPCGQGLSRHLHFVVSDRTLVIDGQPIEEVARVASCCTNPPLFQSSNRRIDEAVMDG